VVGGKIKGVMNCGYARMEELRCAVFHVLSSIDESKDESYREQQEHNLSVHTIQPKRYCEGSESKALGRRARESSQCSKFYRLILLKLLKPDE